MVYKGANLLLKHMALEIMVTDEETQVSSTGACTHSRQRKEDILSDMICIDDHLKSLMEQDTANSNAAYHDFPTPMWVERDVFLKKCVDNMLYSAMEHVLHSVEDRGKVFLSLMAWFNEHERCLEDREVFTRTITNALRS